MNASVRIRTGGEADFDALTDLWERSVRGSHTFMDEAELAHQRPRIRDLLLPSMDVWVAERDGVPVGFVGARDDGVELLYIAPESQGEGIGRTLLSQVAGGAGADRVEVFADNVIGVGFYRSLGYVETERYVTTVAGGTFEILRLRRKAM